MTRAVRGQADIAPPEPGLSFEEWVLYKVVERAKLDAQAWSPYVRREAIEWFRSPEVVPGSFEWVCRLLHEDAEGFRERHDIYGTCTRFDCRKHVTHLRMPTRADWNHYKKLQAKYDGARRERVRARRHARKEGTVELIRNAANG